MNLQFLLAVSPDQFSKPLESWADRISMALEMLLRGMGVIFFVLALLWAILTIFSRIIHRNDPKPVTEKPSPVKQPAPSKKAAPVPTPVAPAPAPVADDGALIAAITAAVAAYLDQSPTNFRVVSFKRTGRKK